MLGRYVASFWSNLNTAVWAGTEFPAATILCLCFEFESLYFIFTSLWALTLREQFSWVWQRTGRAKQQQQKRQRKKSKTEKNEESRKETSEGIAQFQWLISEIFKAKKFLKCREEHARTIAIILNPLGQLMQTQCMLFQKRVNQDIRHEHSIKWLCVIRYSKQLSCNMCVEITSALLWPGMLRWPRLGRVARMLRRVVGVSEVWAHFT